MRQEMQNTNLRPSSYVAFQSNIMQTKLIQEIKFVGEATYETVRAIKFVQTFYPSAPCEFLESS